MAARKGDKKMAGKHSNNIRIGDAVAFQPRARARTGPAEAVFGLVIGEARWGYCINDGPGDLVGLNELVSGGFNVSRDKLFQVGEAVMYTDKHGIEQSGVVEGMITKMHALEYDRAGERKVIPDARFFGGYHLKSVGAFRPEDDHENACIGI